MGAAAARMDMDIALDIAQMAKAAAEEPEKAKPLVGREMTFTVRYTDPEGEQHTARVVSRVLDAAGRLRFDRMTAAQVANIGVSWQLLPDYTRQEIVARSRVGLQLVDPPQWLTTWASTDNDLLFHVSTALEVHEARYFRGDAPKGDGAPQKPRVAVDSVDAA